MRSTPIYVMRIIVPRDTTSKLCNFLMKASLKEHNSIVEYYTHGSIPSNVAKSKYREFHVNS